MVDISSASVNKNVGDSDKMSYRVINFIVVLYFVLFVFYMIGVHNVFTRQDSNDCEMTYMFEYPQYVEISLPESTHKAYPRYALYGYSEGGATEQLRRMQFTGVPVIYLPGSCGSYKQGRSLASVSLRKWLNSRGPVHFDFFLVDLNEELSGVYGGVLSDQREFVKICIDKVLSLYKKTSQWEPPTSVIIIGHSFGGLIAKALFMEPDFNPQAVQLIVTLATPLKHPLIQPDPYIPQLYEEVDGMWSVERVNGSLSHITLVSIGGGARDLVVRSDLTRDIHADVNVLSTAVPSVWCSTDHLSIVWCKQLVLTIVRAMFDVIDLRTRQISTDKEFRSEVFQYHLTKRSAGKRFSTSHHSRLVNFERGGHWVENLQRQFTVLEPRGVKSHYYVMVRLLSDLKHEAMFIEAFNVNIKDWLFVCVADVVHNSVRMCDSGENISNATVISPTQKQRRKVALVNLHHFKNLGFTHVIIKIPPSSSFVQVNVDVHRISDREMNVTAPRLLSPYPHTVLENTHDNAVWYRIKIPGLESVWQALVLQVETTTCRTGYAQAVATLTVPWAAEDYHSYIMNTSTVRMDLRLTTPKPADMNKSEHAAVLLHLDPSCKYRVVLESSLVSAAGQVARYYTPLLPGYVVAVLLLALRKQLQHLHEGRCVIFHTAVAESVRRCHILLQATIYGSKILGFSVFLQVLPLPDSLILHRMHLDFFFLSILMFAIAVIFVYLLGLLCYGTMIVSSQAAHKMALRFIAKAITGVVSWSEWVFVALNQIPFVAATLLASLAVSTSGGLSLWVGAAFYFLKLCKMYEEYLEDLFKYSIKLVAKKLKGMTGTKKSKAVEGGRIQNDKEEATEPTQTMDETNHIVEKSEVAEAEDKEDRGSTRSPEVAPEVGSLSAIHFHVTVFHLWLLAAIIQVPSVLVWARHFHYSAVLSKDPGLVPSLIISACGAFLWQSGLSVPSKRLTTVCSTLLFLLAAFSIMYCTVSLHRLGYVLSSALLIVTCAQVIAGFSPKEKST